MPTAPERFVSRDRRIARGSHCLCCGACYGICKGEARACRVFTCLACGTPQCSVNGLSRGQCAICYSGLLQGWSGSRAGQPCTYKGCSNPAVARGRGGKLVCHVHLLRQQPDFMEQFTARLQSHFILVPATEVPIL